MAAAVMVFAAPSFAQNMDLTGVGNGAVVSNSSAGFGVYVDPYTATVNGVAGASVICDDWSNNSYLNETWTATATSVASLNSGPTTTVLFSGAPASTSPTLPAVSQAVLYDEAAWLASNLLANPTNYGTQVSVSFAIWELTQNATGSANESPTAYSFLQGSNASAYQSTVNSLLAAAAVAVAKGYQGQGWEILTPVDNAQMTGGGSASNPPQEFLVYTPESSSVVLLGADMLGLIALAFVFRRRVLQPVS